MKVRLTTDDHELDQCAKLMFNSDPWITLGFGFEKCKMAMRGDYKEVYVTREGNTITGFVVLVLFGLMWGYIQALCVHPEFRNKSIGTLLLQFSEKRILKMSPNVFMCVSSFNHKAQSLYFRLGFQKIGELKDFVVKGHDEYILRKTIGPFSEFG